MTVKEMIDMLGLRMEDPTEKDFASSLKLDALNLAQKTIVNKIHNAYLTELEVKVFNQTTAVATGDDEASFALIGLTSPMIRSGLVSVKLNGGKFCNLIEPKDVKRTENSYLAGKDENPKSYLYRNRIYIISGTAEPEIDIWYIKEPSALHYKYITDSVNNNDDDSYCSYIEIVESDLISTSNDFYNGSVLYNVTKNYYAIVSDYIGGTTKKLDLIYNIFCSNWTIGDEWYFHSGPGSNQKLGDFESELNESLHETILDFAESHLWLMDNKRDRSNAPYEKAMQTIQELNARYEMEKPKGVGTAGRA